MMMELKVWSDQNHLLVQERAKEDGIEAPTFVCHQSAVLRIYYKDAYIDNSTAQSGSTRIQ